jgi:hypothetical protein
MPNSDTADAFIARRRASGAGERSNFQPFVAEPCDLLGVERPHPAREDNSLNTYVFERPVTFQNGDDSAGPGSSDRTGAASFRWRSSTRAARWYGKACGPGDAA